MDSEMIHLIMLAFRTKSIGDILSTIVKYPYYKLVLRKLGGYVFMSSGIYIGCPRNIEIGNRVTISKDVALRGNSDDETSIVIGDNTNIAEFVILDTCGGYINIGKRCTINQFSVLYGHGGLEIGNDVHIATKCTIIPANHGIKSGTPLFSQPETREGIKIEDDVWIGANVSILDGVTIGTGSVVGAGAVVNRSCLPYSIIAGVPAKLIGRRDNVKG